MKRYITGCFFLTNSPLYLLKEDMKSQATAYLKCHIRRQRGRHGCFRASKVEPVTCRRTSDTLTYFPDGDVFGIA